LPQSMTLDSRVFVSMMARLFGPASSAAEDKSMIFLPPPASFGRRSR
jgi:hypothetical protein